MQYLLTQIIVAINKAMKNAAYSISLKNPPAIHNRNKLEALGYTVKTWSDPRDNDGGTTVSWNNVENNYKDNVSNNWRD